MAIAAAIYSVVRMLEAAGLWLRKSLAPDGNDDYIREKCTYPICGKMNPISGMRLIMHIK